MKSLKLFLIYFLICFSLNCVGQNNFYSNNTTCNQNNSEFASGLVAGLFFNEVFNSSKNTKHMYFVYMPNKHSWRLKKVHHKRQTFFYSNPRVIARFQNPSGGRDFFVKINRHGEWFLDCPKRFRKTLRKKVKNNIHKF
tara:strand:+ start:278 stop:694 length:417 start_codon:yes stop_codon:yes gene_type:complete